MLLVLKYKYFVFTPLARTAPCTPMPSPPFPRPCRPTVLSSPLSLHPCARVKRAHRDTDSHSQTHTHRVTHRPTDPQTHRPTDPQTHRPTESRVGRRADHQAVLHRRGVLRRRRGAAHPRGRGGPGARGGVSPVAAIVRVRRGGPAAWHAGPGGAAVVVPTVHLACRSDQCLGDGWGCGWG